MVKVRVIVVGACLITLAAGAFICRDFFTKSNISQLNSEPYIAASAMPEDGLNFLIEAKEPTGIKEMEGAQGGSSQGEASQGKTSQGKASQGKASQGKASQGNGAEGGTEKKSGEGSGYFLPTDFPDELFFLEETENGPGWTGGVKTGQGSNTGAEPYPESLENKSGEIEKLTYPAQKGSTFLNLPKGGQLRNNTKLSMEEVKNLTAESPDFQLLAPSRQEGPQVLIMHTHTTESYEPYSREFYDSSFSSRTTDPEKNMVLVGEAISKELEAAGVGVIHDSTVHDYPSYNGSYDRSAVTVSNLLMKYPTIKIVLDIHRDAIQRADGVRVAPTVEINGKEAAQIMIIAGCDDGSMNMPNYKKNLAFGSLLEQQLESSYPGLTRPLLFTYKRYNQHLTTGSLLVEVGGHANSLDQAQYSGELIGKALSKLFVSK